MPRTAKPKVAPVEPVNRLPDAEVNGKKPDKKGVGELRIAPLREAYITLPLIGLTPLKCLRFSGKKRSQVQKTQELGSQAKSKRTREAKDFHGEYLEAAYYTLTPDGEEITIPGGIKAKGWLGINASGIRNGCIETCKVCGIFMSRAKMTIFCEQDGFDAIDATPLVRVHGTPEMTVDPVRNASGVIDLRPRVMWKDWKIFVKIRFDTDQFSANDIVNLVRRVGKQNGLGEGRPNGTNGNGTGNGLFDVDLSKPIAIQPIEDPIFTSSK